VTLRVGIVGARRVRQGLGPFVVRHLRELGAAVPCFLVTRADGIPEVERETGARGYTDPRRMLDVHPLDAIAICSPAETHERYLELALDARLHVLCEKPLLWGGAGLGARAAALERAYREAGLGLRECCQWPETLPAYGRLHRDVGPVRSFAMRLSPASREPRVMLADSLSHPLSLVRALVPDAGPATNVGFPLVEPGALSIRFSVSSRAGPVSVDIELVTQAHPPRIAAYAVNDHWAERRIRPGDYTFSFVAGVREVAVPDPLHALLARFVAAPGEPPRGEIATRMADLERILDLLPA